MYPALLIQGRGLTTTATMLTISLFFCAERACVYFFAISIPYSLIVHIIRLDRTEEGISCHLAIEHGEL